jgi:hypothetical protein
MHNVVRYISTPRRELPGLPAAVFVGDTGDIYALADDQQMKPRLFGLLASAGTWLVSGLTVRATPTARPWTTITLVAEDMATPAALAWRRSPSGLLLPIPTGWMTPNMKNHLNSLATDSLRFFDPPGDIFV